MAKSKRQVAKKTVKKTTDKGTGFSLKDELFNRSKVSYLSGLFKASDPKFDSDQFEQLVMKRLKKLELKERIVHIAQSLESVLDPNFKVAAKQIVSALPPPLDPTKTDDDFGDFIFAPLGEFVVRNGMAKSHVGVSLRTLKTITQRFSMEDAIRYFINEHPEKTLAELEKWTADKNYHVRRLVSEGTRARLPWSGRLAIDLEIPLPFLDSLHTDSTRYVTRSVSNHLNDIAKTHPELVLETLKRWKKEAAQASDELAWMTRHSLRTLVKQGNKDALKLLGFRSDPKINVNDLQLSPASLAAGETLEFAFKITAERDESLLIDYVIDFVKANGSTSPKVHKIKQIELSKGESVTLKKRHPFRKNATTFTLYPGVHKLTLQINGKAFESTTFTLTVD